MHRKFDEDAIRNLLETGIEEFAQQGLDRANINTIARNAGVSVGVIYKYYEDKDRFFLACVDHSLQLLEQAMTDVLENGTDFTGSVKLLVKDLIDGAEKHSSYYVMYNEITSGSCRKYAVQLAREIESRTAQIYRTLIAKAQEDGTVTVREDPGMFAFFFDNLLMMLQFSFSCDYYRERMRIFCGDAVMEKPEEIADAVVRFFCRAFGIDQ